MPVSRGERRVEWNRVEWNTHFDSSLPAEVTITAWPSHVWHSGVLVAVAVPRLGTEDVDIVKCEVESVCRR